MSARLFIHLVAVLLFACPGLLTLWVSIRGSSWFFGHSTAKLLVAKLGLRWARLLYGLLGLLMLAAAWLIIADPKGLMVSEG